MNPLVIDSQWTFALRVCLFNISTSLGSHKVSQVKKRSEAEKLAHQAQISLALGKTLSTNPPGTLLWAWIGWNMQRCVKGPQLPHFSPPSFRILPFSYFNTDFFFFTPLTASTGEGACLMWRFHICFWKALIKRMIQFLISEILE